MRDNTPSPASIDSSPPPADTDAATGLPQTPHTPIDQQPDDASKDAEREIAMKIIKKDPLWCFIESAKEIEHPDWCSLPSPNR
jgi:hypothetical protein